MAFWDRFQPARKVSGLSFKALTHLNSVEQSHLLIFWTPSWRETKDAVL